MDTQRRRSSTTSSRPRHHGRPRCSGSSPAGSQITSRPKRDRDAADRRLAGGVRRRSLEHERCSLRLRVVAAAEREVTLDALVVPRAAGEGSSPGEAGDAARATFPKPDGSRDADRPAGVVAGASQDCDVSASVQDELACARPCDAAADQYGIRVAGRGERASIRFR